MSDLAIKKQEKRRELTDDDFAALDYQAEQKSKLSSLDFAALDYQAQQKEVDTNFGSDFDKFSESLFEQKVLAPKNEGEILTDTIDEKTAEEYIKEVEKSLKKEKGAKIKSTLLNVALAPIKLGMGYFRTLARPSAAFYESAYGLSHVRYILNREKELGLWAKPGEIRISYPIRTWKKPEEETPKTFYPYANRRYIFYNKENGTTRIVDVTPEQLYDVKDRREIPKKILSLMGKGAIEGFKLKGDTAFSGDITRDILTAVYPSAPKPLKYTAQAGAFALDIFMDPTTYGYGLLASKAPKLASKIGGLLKNTSAGNTIITAIENSAPVLALKGAFGLWTGGAKRLDIKAIQTGIEERTKITALLAEKIKPVEQSYKTLLETMAEESGKKVTKKFTKEVAADLYLIERMTERDKLALTLDEAINKVFPGASKAKKRAVIDFFEKAKEFSEVPKIRKLKEIKIKKEAYEKYLWWFPLRTEQSGRLKLKPYQLRKQEMPKSTIERTIKNIEDFTDYLEKWKYSLKGDIPTSMVEDIIEHAHKQFTQGFWADALEFLEKNNIAKKIPESRKIKIKVGEEVTKVSVKIKSELDELFKLAETGHEGLENAVRVVQSWRSKESFLPVIKFLEDAGMNINDVNNIKNFLRGHAILRPRGRVALFKPETQKLLAITKRTPAYLTDNQIVKYFKEFEQFVQPESVKTFTKVLRAIQIPFKYMAVGINPFFTSKYLFTDLFQIWKGGMHPLQIPKRLIKSTILKTSHKTNYKIAVGNQLYDSEDYYKLLNNLGVTGRARRLLGAREEQMIEDIMQNYMSPMFMRKIGKVAYHGPSSITQHLDDIPRIALFENALEDAVKRGYKLPTPEELKAFLKLPWEEGYKKMPEPFIDALAHVFKHMYSYQSTPVVRKYLKPFIPFVQWQVENVPEMIRFMFQLDKIEQIGRGSMALEKMFPVKTKYPPNNLDKLYELPIGDGNIHVYFSIPAPFKDLNKYLDFENAVGNIFSLTGPIASVASFFTKTYFFPETRTIEDDYYTEAPVWAIGLAKSPLSKYFPNLWKISWVPDTGELRLMMNARYMYFFESQMPTLNTIKRLTPNSTIRIMVDRDKVDEYKKKIYMKKEVEGYPIIVGYEKPQIEKMPLRPAPTASKGLAEARRLKRKYPFLSFSYSDDLQEQKRIIYNLRDYLLKQGGRLRADGSIILPEQIDDIYHFLSTCEETLY